MLKKAIQRYAVAFGMAAAMFAAGAGGIQKANAAEIARDIYKYYFGKASKAEKKATTALLPTGSDGSND